MEDVYQGICLSDEKRVTKALEKGYDVNRVLELYGKILPLHLAIREKSLKMMEMLVKYGADPNIKDHRGQTALHVAVHTGEIKVVKYLVKVVQADLFCLDSSDLIAEQIAFYSSQWDILLFLINQRIVKTKSLQKDLSKKANQKKRLLNARRLSLSDVEIINSFKERRQNASQIACSLAKLIKAKDLLDKQSAHLIQRVHSLQNQNQNQNNNNNSHCDTSTKIQSLEQQLSAIQSKWESQKESFCSRYQNETQTHHWSSFLSEVTKDLTFTQVLF